MGVYVHACVCTLHLQRTLMSPAGPVRLFGGALSSQLEAAAVTFLPNIPSVIFWMGFSASKSGHCTGINSPFIITLRSTCK